MRGRAELTAERLREVLSCNPETGLFTCKVSRGNIRAGSIAGIKRHDGYIRIYIDGRWYMAHRLIWLHAYGTWPEHEIDHVDGDKTNNRLCNLRLATTSQNNANRPVHKNNKCGFKGVALYRGKWRSQIQVDGKNHHLGYFDTAEEAHAAYVAAAEKHFGRFARRPTARSASNIVSEDPGVLSIE
jgi:hypothetical protein